MERCEICQNEYDKSFYVILNGKTHTFDCFECAIQSLAPPCSRCHVKVVGHGVEVNNEVFCSASCAHLAGRLEPRDRIPAFGYGHL